MSVIWHHAEDRIRPSALRAVAMGCSLVRNQWYGDNRDVVKWSALLQIARREQLSAILQVALFRPDDDPPKLSTAKGQVFLDPDTGMAPQVPGREHVTQDELRMTFDAMKPKDALVCYQHARRQKDWRGVTRRAFAKALDVPSYQVEVFESALARDIVLFAAVKGC